VPAGEVLMGKNGHSGRSSSEVASQRDWVSTSVAAERLGIVKQAVRSLIKEGVLRARKIKTRWGWAWRIDPASLEQYQANNIDQARAEELAREGWLTIEQLGHIIQRYGYSLQTARTWVSRNMIHGKVWVQDGARHYWLLSPDEVREIEKRLAAGDSAFPRVRGNGRSAQPSNDFQWIDPPRGPNWAHCADYLDEIATKWAATHTTRDGWTDADHLPVSWRGNETAGTHRSLYQCTH